MSNRRKYMIVIITISIIIYPGLVAATYACALFTNPDECVFLAQLRFTAPWVGEAWNEDGFSTGNWTESAFFP
ncbi:MAG: hypothetical protein D9C04_03535 [Nitrosopumilus sp. B06]|nr:MAG: hypothetical protein D9C04_03535 [Nitrosopumilus sp. B06]